ncbi:NAD-dependent protein deacetylase Sir2B-like [Pararge aegeria]|uniref:NAD-dependent protein deacetylase Sir2B-like n=1 Tax=Pararge aegeria TaxID=116150 RepID=UPI0019D22C23|nr:NAD-dependent protein deacetylase Sir2B-like [Pararge aegeria]
MPSDVNRNVVYPTIFCNSNIEEEVNNNTIEIVELNSDASENEQKNTNNHSWCNTNGKFQEQQDDYKVNRAARDKRRHNNEKDFVIISENFNDDKYNDHDVLNQFCTDFYGFDCYDRGERISTVNNPRSELITFINNYKTSDTSSDTNLYDDNEVIQCDRTIENDYWISDHDSDTRNITYDVDCNGEKPTFWIYALKNKRYMSEHDFELSNISSKESTSTTDDEQSSNNIPNIQRIATPIPAYIPKMNFPLSPTLPTVTEVTEPNKQASNNSDISTTNTEDTTHLQKPLNGWFKNDTPNDKPNSDNIEPYENNWQPLSPRERRRLRLNKQNELNTQKETKTLFYCEPEIIIGNKELTPTLNIESFEKEIDENNEDDQVKNEHLVSSENKNDSEPDEPLNNLQKPQIKIGTKMKTRTKDITDPIKKLDGNWIGQSLPHCEKLLEVYDYNFMDTEDNDAQLASQSTGGAMEEGASELLFIRNMSLLKPAEWTQYLPLTDSVPSLHLSLSIDTDFNHDKKSWLKSFLRFINCCK